MHGVLLGTHGEANSTRFQSDRDESPIPPNGVEWIDTGEVYQKRVSAVGSGAPPFQSGIPPINLAFVDACDTGQDSAMGEAFLHPFANHVDRAHVAWTFKVSIHRAWQYGLAFWEALKARKTVGQARKAAVTRYNQLLEPGEEKIDDEALRITGDPKTRLHGVYTGNQLLPQRYGTDRGTRR